MNKRDAQILDHMIATEQHERVIRKIVSINGYNKNGPLMSALGNSYLKLNEYSKAKYWAMRALDFHPSWRTYQNVACILMRCKPFDAKMIEVYFQEALKACETDIDKCVVLENFASFYDVCREYQKSVELYKKVLSINGNSVNAKLGLSGIAMRGGDYFTGLYIYRDRPDDFHAISPWPRWEGQGLSDKHILVRCEQGAGDCFQFLRYVNVLAEKAMRITLHASEPFIPFLKEWCNFSDNVTIAPKEISQYEKYDFYAMLLDIPFYVANKKSSRRGDYISDMHAIQRIDPDVSEFDFSGKPFLRLINIPKNNGPVIGFCWAGNPKHKNDFYRSLDPNALNDLIYPLKYAGFKIISLQKGVREKEYNIDNMDIRSAKNWCDTADIVKCCDVVVTVDTSIAHLSASMGIKTFIIIPSYAEWRWGDAGEKTLWYPSMTILRASEKGGINGCMNFVADYLTGDANAKAYHDGYDNRGVGMRATNPTGSLSSDASDA